MKANSYFIEGDKQPFKTVANRVRCYTVPRPPQNEIEKAIKEAKAKYKLNELRAYENSI